MDNVLFFIKEIRSTELILDNLGIPFSLEDKEDLLEIMCYVSMLTKMPLECDHLFVCIVASEACETDDDESGVIIKFKLPTGIHVDDDDATSWDSFK